MADTNEFRHLLRKLRTERGLSQDAVGAEVHLTGSQIGHYETGRSVPPESMAEALDRFLDAGGSLKEAAEQSRVEAVAPWLRPWRHLEERASLLRWYEPNLIPGLLQTEEYARSIIATGSHPEVQVEQMTHERMARQAATLGRADPMMLSAIIGEAALRHGDPAMMKDQLAHLIDVGHRPNVHLRVVPFAAGLHIGLVGAFGIAMMPDSAVVGFQDGAIEGHVISRARDLRQLAWGWESICARALTWEATIDFILKVINEYEGRTELVQKQL